MLAKILTNGKFIVLRKGKMQQTGILNATTGERDPLARYLYWNRLCIGRRLDENTGGNAIFDSDLRHRVIEQDIDARAFCYPICTQLVKTSRRAKIVRFIDDIGIVGKGFFWICMDSLRHTQNVGGFRVVLRQVVIIKWSFAVQERTFLQHSTPPGPNNRCAAKNALIV